MEPVTIIIMLALIEYLVMSARVGLARGRTGVTAPAVTGNEEFERHFRVHYNTLEQLVVFIPAIWCFGLFISPLWAALIGAIFLLGRAMYAVAYVRNPDSRGPGMILSVLPCYVLVLGALGGAVWNLVG